MNPQQSIVQVLQQTPPAEIGELDFVRDKYIQNYNACHSEKIGELIYYRNVMHFKQIINGSDQLKNCDKFSLYACFVTASVNGYSLDPADDEVYIVPQGGKARLQRQAGAYVRKLKQSGQIIFADQPVIVYEGDIYVVKHGRVIEHEEMFQSDIYKAAYQRFVIDDKGRDLFATFRKSDWEAWRAKSTQKDGPNWKGLHDQPQVGFLKTKVTLHACKEKHWATGNTPPIDQFTDVEVDAADEDYTSLIPAIRPEIISKSQTPFKPVEQVKQQTPPQADAPPAQVVDDMPPTPLQNNNTVTVDNDSF